MRNTIASLAMLLVSCGNGAASNDGGASGPSGTGTVASVASADPPVAPSPLQEGVVATDAGTLLSSALTPRQSGRYAPRDECAGVPGAAAFRQELAEALVSGDAEKVAGLAEPDVKLGFGGDDGAARLRQRLDEADREYLDEWRKVLGLGCAREGGDTIVMPWLFAQDPGDADPYMAMVVTTENVPLLAGPSRDAKILARLSWDIVTLSGGLQPDRPFQAVETTDGTRGYMATGMLRSQLDYRLIAERRGGAWRVTAFVAGD